MNVTIMASMKVSKPSYLISPPEHWKKLQMSFGAEVMTLTAAGSQRKTMTAPPSCSPRTGSQRIASGSSF